MNIMCVYMFVVSLKGSFAGNPFKDCKQSDVWCFAFKKTDLDASRSCLKNENCDSIIMSKSSEDEDVVEWTLFDKQQDTDEKTSFLRFYILRTRFAFYNHLTPENTPFLYMAQIEKKASTYTSGVLVIENGQRESLKDRSGSYKLTDARQGVVDGSTYRSSQFTSNKILVFKNHSKEIVYWIDLASTKVYPHLAYSGANGTRRLFTPENAENVLANEGNGWLRFLLLKIILIFLAVTVVGCYVACCVAVYLFRQKTEYKKKREEHAKKPKQRT